MKLTTACLTATLASLASLSVAENCTPGLYYCGFNLLQKGNVPAAILRSFGQKANGPPTGDYQRTIELELIGMGEPTDEASLATSLFWCRTDKTNGAIFFMRHCKGGQVCSDGGPGQSDYCG